MHVQRKFDILIKLAGMKNAPNYRTTSRVQRRCATCVHFQGKKEARVGRCNKFKFVASANGLCDEWKKSSKK